MSPTLIIGAVLSAALAFAVWYGIDADAALDKTRKLLVTAELQRDQFAKGLTQCRTEIAEKNAIIMRTSRLPIDRLRLCVQRPADDGCCKPAPAVCKP